MKKLLVVLFILPALVLAAKAAPDQMDEFTLQRAKQVFEQDLQKRVEEMKALIDTLVADGKISSEEEGQKLLTKWREFKSIKKEYDQRLRPLKTETDLTEIDPFFHCAFESYDRHLTVKRDSEGKMSVLLTSISGKKIEVGSSRHAGFCEIVMIMSIIGLFLVIYSFDWDINFGRLLLGIGIIVIAIIILIL